MTTFRAGDFTYDLDETWGNVPEGYTFHQVSGVAVDRGDNVYLFNLETHDLMVFDRTGQKLRLWAHKYSNAHGVHVGADGSVYIADRDVHVVHKYTPDGKLLFTLGAMGVPSDTGYSLDIGRKTAWKDPVPRAAGPFNVPSGIAVAPNGDIYVSDGYANCRIHRFASDGRLLVSWGAPGRTKPAEFHLIHGLCLDGSGRLLVCDRMNNRVQLFDLTGNHLETWTGFAQPSTVAVSRDGIVCVAEHMGRLSLLDKAGRVLARWDGPQFVHPHGVAMDSRGDIYFGQVQLDRRVIKLVRR